MPLLVTSPRAPPDSNRAVRAGPPCARLPSALLSAERHGATCVATAEREALQRKASRSLPAALAATLRANRTRTIDLFRVMDMNLDGVVSKDELGKMLENIGLHVGAAELDELFERLDPDGSGGIVFRELHRVLREAELEEEALRSPPRAALDARAAAFALSYEQLAAAPAAEVGERPVSEDDLRVLEEILAVATAHAARETGELSAERIAANVTLVGMQNAYETVLAR